jgi:calcium-dependent protein kinase
VLDDSKVSPLKKADHKNAILRELDAVRRLRGALNVAALEEAYEDDDNVYMITELCRGGELWHRIGERHYSERTVSHFCWKHHHF